jgi:FkbM family methyltransferase
MIMLPNGIAVCENDTGISKITSRNGSLTEPGMWNWLLPVIPDCELGVDVGAAIGDSTAVLLTRCQQVWAFEPNPEYFECLEENCKTAHQVHAALGDRKCTKQLRVDDGDMGDGFLCDKGGKPVPVKTLDSFKLHANFIKIDAEGCELFVLRGAKRTIEKYRPVIVLEVNHKAMAVQGYDEAILLAYIESINYRWHRINGTDEVNDILLNPL